MIKVLYIISDIDRARAFEWIAGYYHSKPDIDVAFCFLSATKPASAEYLEKLCCNVSYIELKGKRGWLPSFAKLVKLLRHSSPDIVHCHLLTASVLGLTAACFANIKCRIFTRHHGSMHHTRHRKGLFWDVLCNRLASKIVSISPATSIILSEWERVPKEKLVFIPHGFPLSAYGEDYGKQPDLFKCDHGIPAGRRIVGVVSRFEDWKGVQYIIAAFKAALRDHNNIHLLLMNAVGSYAHVIQELLQGIPSGHYSLIPFAPDIASAYAAMDVFVHVPIDAYVEAFGQVYVEALAAGVPMICTLSGIAPAIIKDNDNALVVPFCDSQAIADRLLRLLEHPRLGDTLASNGRRTVLASGFSLEEMCKRLDELYLSSILK